MKIAQSYNLAILILLAVIVQLFWFSFVDIGFFMDTESYLNYSLGIINKSLDYGNASVNDSIQLTAYARRTVGYPIILLVSGLPLTNSVYGILAIQAAMSLMMVYLFYKMLLISSEKAAFLFTILFVLSLQPFDYSKAISTEHSYKFLLLLLSYWFLTFDKDKMSHYIRLLCLGILLSTVRPTGLYIFLFATVLLMVTKKVSVVKISKLYAIFAITMFTINFLPAAAIINKTPVEIPKGEKNVMNRIELALLEFAYAENSIEYSVSDCSENNTAGCMVLSYLNDHNDWIGYRPKSYFAPYINKNVELANVVFLNKNPYYFRLFKDSLEYANAKNQIVTWKYVAERYIKNPILVLKLINRYLFSSSVSFAPQQSWSQIYNGTHAEGFSPVNTNSEKKLNSLLQVYFSDFPDYVPSIWSKYSNDLNSFYSQVLVGSPSEGNWYFLWEVTDRLLGLGHSGSFFRDLQIESPSFVYSKLRIALDNFGQFWIGMPSYNIAGKKQFDDAMLFDFKYLSNQIPSKLKDALSGRVTYFEPLRSMTIYPLISQAFTIYELVIRTVCFFIIVCGGFFVIHNDKSKLFILLIGAILFHSISVALIGDVYFRYIDQIMPLIMLAAAFALIWIYRSNARSSDL